MSTTILNENFFFLFSSRPCPYSAASSPSSESSNVLCPLLSFAAMVFCFHSMSHRLVGLVVKASASRAEDPGFESHLQRDFSGVESYQRLKNWHSSGYPARRLAFSGQRWDWLARCQYTVTGRLGKLDLQLLSQCGSTSNCLSRSVPEIHSHVAETLSNQPTNQQTLQCLVFSDGFGLPGDLTLFVKCHSILLMVHLSWRRCAQPISILLL